MLPFVDLSAQQDQQYFSDGLTEELISQLAAELPLRVIARTSSFSFKGENPDIATVAEKLGYGSASAFSAMFKRVLGCSPREFFGRQAR